MVLLHFSLIAGERTLGRDEGTQGRYIVCSIHGGCKWFKYFIESNNNFINLGFLVFLCYIFPTFQARVAKRQTHYLEVVALVRAWRFKSSPAHQNK